MTSRDNKKIGDTQKRHCQRLWLAKRAFLNDDINGANIYRAVKTTRLVEWSVQGSPIRIGQLRPPPPSYHPGCTVGGGGGVGANSWTH